MTDKQVTDPYSALARGYDLVMRHVEYNWWAAYINELLRQIQAPVRTVLELGCGTGSLALALQPMGAYDYTATDRSESMIRRARAKAAAQNSPVRFEVVDFTDFEAPRPVDLVLLLYDGMNYLLEASQVGALLRCAYRALTPGGHFIVDQSTPVNSINNEAFFEDEGDADGFTYVRRSRYDAASRLHRTTFDLTIGDHIFFEEHVQRAYSLQEMRGLVRESGFREVAAYDGLTTFPATERSERIHWVLQRP